MNQYYAIKAPDGNYSKPCKSEQSAKMQWTKDNIQDTSTAYGRMSWKWWLERGYRCVAIEITEKWWD
jgi:hypothetical protein